VELNLFHGKRGVSWAFEYLAATAHLGAAVYEFASCLRK
jgi:hypothetical protein